MVRDSEQPESPRGPGSDEILRMFIDSAKDIAIVVQDGEGRVTSWNIGAERLTGYTAAEIVGRLADVIFTPEDRASGAPEAERARARTEGSAENERWHLRRDGTRFWGSGLLLRAAGPGQGFVKVMRDLTERHEAAERLRENEARLRLLTTNIPQLLFRTRVTGERSWGSPQWERFTGLSGAASRGFGWMDAVHPDDRAATHAAWTEAAGRGEFYVEHRIRRAADGMYRWHQTRARPVQEEAGAGSAEWVGTSADVHEMRELQDRQRVLLAELQHRTRNLLAVVQSIARQTLRLSPSLEAFGQEFESRLHALGRVQGLLARVDHETVELRGLVEAELAAHADDSAPQRTTVGGPTVFLAPNAAQALALALHELATNAVKYGALGQPEGRLRVSWRIETPEGEPRRVTLTWQESGVAMPAEGHAVRRGYGSELIERALPYQLQAKTRLVFRADGVRCTIAVPLGGKGGGA